MSIRLAAVLLVGALGCLRTSTSECADGYVCRANTTCLIVQLAAGEPAHLCVSDPAFAACKGLDEGAPCTFVGGEGSCASGACLVPVCGDGVIEPGEVCDDGNQSLGDGCGADCRSNETCGNGRVDPIRIAGGEATPFEQCDGGDVLGHDGCSSTCAVEITRWTPLRVPRLGREGAVMAADPVRDRIVMFGGRFVAGNGVSTTFGETWEWSRTGWQSISTPSGPVGRAEHAMTFDGETRKILLFGGVTGANGGRLGDVWELDGTRWTRLFDPAPAPSARSRAAMAYLPGVGVVLFGGETANGKPSGETWIRHSGTWMLASPTGSAPSARIGHAMALDPIRGVLVMSGGIDVGGTAVDETWELDATLSWRLKSTAAGPAPYQSSLVFDPGRRAIVAVAGLRAGTYEDSMWTWDGMAWTMITPPMLPGPRRSAAISASPATGELVLFGGYLYAGCGACAPTRSDTWLWNGTTWSQALEPTPPGVSKVVGAYDRDRQRAIVEVLDGTTATTWEIEGSRWIATTPTGPTPGFRVAAAMAYDPARHRTVLFGGAVAGAPSNEMWLWDGASWTDRTMTGPPAVSGHAMAFDEARGRLVMIGGLDKTGSPNLETWEWDGTAWTQALVVGPGERSSAAMGYDPVRHRIVVFGGLHASLPTAHLGDTWEWDGVTWLERTPVSSPPDRAGASMAWDAARRRNVMFGGGQDLGNDTWEWDGTAWTFVPVLDRIPPRANHVMMPSPRGGVIAVGGLIDTAGGPDTQRLSRDADAPYESCRTAVDDDRDGLAGCADPDCWAQCTPACPPGAPCAAGSPRCGDGACSPALENCRICPSDCSCMPLCGDLRCDPGETPTSCRGDCP